MLLACEHGALNYPLGTRSPVCTGIDKPWSRLQKGASCVLGVCCEYIWGDFQLKSCEEIQAFSLNHFANIFAKLVFQLGHSAPKSFAHFLCSTIMGVVKWKRDLWWLLLFCENMKWERFWPFPYRKIPWMFNVTLHRCALRPLKFWQHRLVGTSPPNCTTPCWFGRI